jgi:Holliday junction DNA helicase RuvB
MDFSEQFREIFRKTREFVGTGNTKGAILGCRELADLCKTQHALKNGDKIKIKASLKHHAANFSTLAKNIATNGIDNHINEFFGFTTQKRSVMSAESTKNFRSTAEDEMQIVNVSTDPIDTLGCTPYEKKKHNSPVSTLVGSEYEPQTLAEFIGQSDIVERLQTEISVAKKRGLKYIDNILFFGNRGLGKSTLMKLVAKELGARFEYLDCSQFRNDVASQLAVQNFFQRIGKDGQPIVIGMDEMHELPGRLQSGLLTLLNDRAFVYMDNNGKNHNIPIDDFTFIGATTNAHEVLTTIKDRCLNLTFYLTDYNNDELYRIFQNKFASQHLKINDDAISECINRCRSSVREVNAIISGLNSIAISADTNLVDMDMTTQYFNNAGIDPIGLKTKDLEILNAIHDDSSGTMAEDTLAARVGIESAIYRSEYEPYLLKIGFISISGRGRSLTEKAEAYLKGKSNGLAFKPSDPIDDMI